MSARQLKSQVHAVGAIDWDRTLFDALIPLPQGTSYNSYLIQGSEKTALIDTVEPAKWQTLKNNIEQLKVGKIDYVISNHAEQDHSGCIPQILKMYPSAKVVTNNKCQNILTDLLDIPDEKFTLIDDRDTLSLGDKTLEFIFTPWVHWPETMVTLLKEDNILFSCDFFGSHLATSDLFTKDGPQVYQEAKRYYAEIMMPFAKSIKKHLKVLDEYKFDMIAPSHGPIYANPEFIINAYKNWTSDNVKNEVLLLYVSMHGSTEKMTHYLTDTLMSSDITVKPFNMMSADIGEIALDLVDAATIVIASPTFLMGLHPNMVYAIYLINSLKPKTKYAAIIGSYSWSNKLGKQIATFTDNLKVEFLPPVLIKGFPHEVNFSELNQLANLISEKHSSLGIR